MSFEVLHFRDSDKILEDKHMTQTVLDTLMYINDALTGSLYRGELFRQVLKDTNWINGNNGKSDMDNRRILEGRRYCYKGFMKGVALESNLASYEYILEGLFRLQIGVDKGLIETGILILNGSRSEKTPYGSSSQMVHEEIDLLYPTIDLPVCIALFDLNEPEE